MNEETIPVRIYPNELNILRKIALIREENKEETLEYELPTPAKILHYILRNPKVIGVIKTEICKLPAKEDLIKL